ncbi:MAG: hypothetical protein ABJA82_12705 [Myxococcales bacterium]
MPTWLSFVLALAGAAGCGDRLVSGSFAGDATVRIHATAQLAVAVAVAGRPRVAALWLGYGAAAHPLEGIETTVLPVSSVGFPPSFTFDVLTAPPSAGNYATRDGRIIPAEVRFARFALFDDLDADDTLALDDTGAVVPPDRLLARTAQHLLLFVAQPASQPAALDGADALLTNWEDAGPGYHVVELDPAVTPPDFAGHVVPPETFVRFYPEQTSQ